MMDGSAWRNELVHSESRPALIMAYLTSCDHGLYCYPRPVRGWGGGGDPSVLFSSDVTFDVEKNVVGVVIRNVYFLLLVVFIQHKQQSLW